jgi:hypothetical protein
VKTIWIVGDEFVVVVMVIMGALNLGMEACGDLWLPNIAEGRGERERKEDEGEKQMRRR